MNEYRKITELHNWEHNPRSVTKEGIERLKKQILKLKQYKGLLILEDGTVIGGNMRLKALQDLGIKEAKVNTIKVIEKDGKFYGDINGDISEPFNSLEELKIEYALSDNDRVGKYEGDQLADLIGNFPEVEWNDYAVDIKEPQLVSDIMDQYSEVVEDEVPEVPKVAESKLGEVYTLGRHRLLCGDATKIEDVEKLMNGQKADMVFTDPPYGIDLDTDWSDAKSSLNFLRHTGAKPQGNKYGKVIGDAINFNPTHIFNNFNCKEIFLWGVDYYKEYIPKTGSWFVWDKRSNEGTDYNKISQSDKMYGSLFELCWSKNKHKREIARIKWAGIFGTELEPDKDKSRIHPTQKPVALATWFYKKFTKEGDIIVDLYGGSGSFLIACEQTNRTCYMMEIDPLYVDVIRARYKNYLENKEKQAK